jgi:transposase
MVSIPSYYFWVHTHTLFTLIFSLFIVCLLSNTLQLICSFTPVLSTVCWWLRSTSAHHLIIPPRCSQSRSHLITILSLWFPLLSSCLCPPSHPGTNHQRYLVKQFHAWLSQVRTICIQHRSSPRHLMTLQMWLRAWHSYRTRHWCATQTLASLSLSCTNRFCYCRARWDTE